MIEKSVFHVCLKGGKFGFVHQASQAMAFYDLKACNSACQWVGCCMQVSFIFGYSMKLQSVVKTMGGLRALTLPFSTPIQNTLVHDLTVKVSMTRSPEVTT